MLLLKLGPVISQNVKQLLIICYVAVVKFLTLEDGTAGLSRNVGKKLPPRRAKFSNLHKFGVRSNPSFCNDGVLLGTTVTYLSPFFFSLSSSWIKIPQLNSDGRGWDEMEGWAAGF